MLALTSATSVSALRPERPRDVASSLLLVRAFLASVYLWAGIYKLRPDWLDGRTLALYQADGALDGFHGAIELSANPDLLGWERAALLLCLWPPRTRR